MAEIRLVNISKKYGTVLAVERVNLTAAEGEFLSLLGPSGCGKTTILRVIAGLVQPTEGDVFIGGRRMTDVPVHRRNLAMVFQNYALFPHMTVAENVAFGLRMRGFDSDTVRKRVREALALVGLTGFESRFPSQLSGGQQQRVAVARAIVVRPSVLLLDEPFAALDRKMRERMQVEFKLLQQQLGITTIFVTHDQDEALSMSDRVVVMNGGRIEQVGTPREVYERPATRFVATFIGLCNVFSGTVLQVDGPHVVVRTDKGSVISVVHEGTFQVDRGAKVEVAVRPEAIRILKDRSFAEGCEPLANQFHVTITHVAYMGTVTQYHTKTESGDDFVVYDGDARSLALGKGSRLAIGFPASSVRLLPVTGQGDALEPTELGQPGYRVKEISSALLSRRDEAGEGC